MCRDGCDATDVTQNMRRGASDTNHVRDACDALKIFSLPEVDAIFVSYVRGAETVEKVRDLIRDFGKSGQKISVISKIEDEEGCERAAEIIDASDGILVARGDMGIEIPAEKVS